MSINVEDGLTYYPIFKSIATSIDIDLYLNSLKLLVDFTKKSKDSNIVSFFSNTNWLYHLLLFIKQDDVNSARDLFESLKLFQKHNITQYELTLFSLLKTNQFLLIEEFYNFFKMPNSAFSILFAGTFIESKINVNLGIKLLIEFINSVPKITQTNLYHITQYIDLWFLSNQRTIEFYKDYLADKEYESPDMKILIEVYSISYNESILNQKEKIILIFDRFETLNYQTRILLAVILSRAKEFEKSIKVIISIPYHKKEPVLLKIYILNLIYTGDKIEELLELFSFYRNFKVETFFLHKEIEIYYQLGDFQKILELSRIGTNLFPEQSDFRYYKIIALYYIESKEIEEEFTIELINNFKFPWRNAFFLARIASEKGNQKIALEIIYKYTKENFENQIVKDAYFMFYIYHVKEEHGNIIEIVPGTTAKFKIDNEIRIKYFNEEDSKNELFKNFFNKSIGKYTISKGLGLGNYNLEILEITDKFRGLFLEISELIKDPYTGSEIKSIETPGDIDEFNKKLIEKFGVQSGINQRLIKERIEFYKLGQISFTELYHTISNDDIFDSYLNMRFRERIFIVPPKEIFSKIDLTSTNNYILDIPSIILFSDLGTELNLKFENKFLISFYAKEYFKMLIKEEQSLNKSNLSLSLNETTLTLIKYPDNFQELRIGKLQNILNWINENCVLGIAKNKLDLISKLNGNENFNSFFWNYLIDTISLSQQNNNMLISDDSIFYNFFKQFAPAVSTEYYLIKLNKTDKTLISKLIEYGNVGLTISLDQLIFEFEKSPILESNNNGFLNAVRSLDYYFNPLYNNLDTSISFLKYIYSLSIDLKTKKRISQLVLFTTLKNYQLQPRDIKELPNKIRKELHLLGSSDLQALDDLTSVFNILNLSKNL